MKRASVTLRGKGPITRYADRMKVRTTAQLSKECGWQKPLVKVAGKEKQQ